MKDKDSQLIWEFWEADEHSKKVAYKAGYELAKSGRSKSDVNVSDVYGPASSAFDRGYHDGLADHEGHESGDEAVEEDISAGKMFETVYVVADRDGVYGVYTDEKTAQAERDDVGGGSYITEVSVDTPNRQY